LRTSLRLFGLAPIGNEMPRKSLEGKTRQFFCHRRNRVGTAQTVGLGIEQVAFDLESSGETSQGTGNPYDTMTIAIGVRPFAAPTARTAVG
jgi:hypothetical protein